MRTLINAAGIVVVVAALVVFCVLNIGEVDLTLPVLNNWQFEYPAWPLPLCVLVLVPFGFGIVLGCLLDAVKIYQLKREVRILKKASEQHSAHITPEYPSE
jgi:uncharacterized integral membrane protein